MVKVNIHRKVVAYVLERHLPLADVNIIMERRLVLAGLAPNTDAFTVAAMMRQAASDRGVEVLTTCPIYIGKRPRHGQRMCLHCSRRCTPEPPTVAVKTAAGNLLGFLPTAPAEVLAGLLKHGLMASGEVIEAGRLRVLLHAD